MDKQIILTGGGTAGHVTPNLALVEALTTDGWQIAYVGSIGGVEESIIKSAHIPYYAIRTGKLRRYFSWKNFIDPLNVIFGVIQSYLLLNRLKTKAVFSKGGFVALPVVIAAYLKRIPVVIHESDMTPGLANKCSFPFARVICLNFASTKKYIKNHKKLLVTGTPIREQLFHGDKARGLQYCGFTDTKPCLLVMGGGQGSVALNRCIRASLDVLCQTYQVIHLCGDGKQDQALAHRADYFQLEYVNDVLADLFAASDLVLSRAGANSLCELLALQKPHILVPLSRKASRGDQIQNAQYFEEQGISVVIQEEQLSTESLITAIERVEVRRAEILHHLEHLGLRSGAQQIVDILKQVSGSGFRNSRRKKSV